MMIVLNPFTRRLPLLKFHNKIRTIHSKQTKFFQNLSFCRVFKARKRFCNLHLHKFLYTVFFLKGDEIG